MKRLKLYRILTENTNYDGIQSLVYLYFPEGASIYSANGLWNGKTERSLIIEVQGLNIGVKVRKLAKAIKTLNKQEAVLVQWFEIHGEFV